MADASKTVKMVAIERGFRNGRMVEPGAKFNFDLIGPDGKPQKLPKWAVQDGEPMPQRANPKGGDTRPKDAQDAAKAKMGEVSAGLV